MQLESFSNNVNMKPIERWAFLRSNLRADVSSVIAQFDKFRNLSISPSLRIPGQIESEFIQQFQPSRVVINQLVPRQLSVTH